MNRLAAGHGRPAISPSTVPDAPCLKNIFLGENVNITRLPAPLLHQGVGGRYLNTYGMHHRANARWLVDELVDRPHHGSR